MTQAWNATVTQSGAQVTARNVGYNGSLVTNASASFGFNGSFSGTAGRSDFVSNSFSINYS
ncbi:cellulose binding domain-containing protein [Microbispora siamensis]|uniref:CBM2 domain-containing protein n=1 Tax=Microbispora siamensis TaxID=564413 RepID=A0ABQ4GJM5_9ACTN|nr:cellulose binding domain-containing protein [Microbispora siamensis]GIH61638.1 hypothetical protein Msi02_24550 [Microbispora siamensis]